LLHYLLREDLGINSIRILFMLLLHIGVYCSVVISNQDPLLQGSIGCIVVSNTINLEWSSEVENRSHILNTTCSNKFIFRCVEKLEVFEQLLIGNKLLPSGLYFLLCGSL
jgi:hypothetical protein